MVGGTHLHTPTPCVYWYLSAGIRKPRGRHAHRVNKGGAGRGGDWYKVLGTRVAESYLLLCCALSACCLLALEFCFRLPGLAECRGDVPQPLLLPLPHLTVEKCQTSWVEPEAARGGTPVLLCLVKEEQEEMEARELPLANHISLGAKQCSSLGSTSPGE